MSAPAIAAAVAVQNAEPATGRAAMLEQFDTHISNLRACVHWLTGLGVSIHDVDMRRGRSRPVIELVPSPLLRRIFKGDCSSGRHFDVRLGRPVHDFKAVRYECEIRWQEVACG